MLQCDLARSSRQPLLLLVCAVALACTDAGDPLGPGAVAPSGGVGFTGMGAYLGPKSSKDRRAAATALATALERYNSAEITADNDCG